MKFDNFFMLLGIMFIFTFPVIAMLDIGQQRTCEGVWTWHTSAIIFVSLVVPFILGYLARNPNDKTIFDE